MNRQLGVEQMKQYRESLSELTWTVFTRWLGEPGEVVRIKNRCQQQQHSIERLEAKLADAEARNRELETSVSRLEQRLEEAERELQNARDEKLGWMAKEASTRKELQDCKERNKELLEKVVELTQQKRKADQTLLEQKMRTEATPLERNRFEAELAEARARMREAEERVREAEQRAKRAEVEAARTARLEKQLERMKELEEKLSWERVRADSNQKALAAALGRLAELEQQMETLRKAPQVSAPSRRPWRKPRIRQSRAAVVEK
ncbi:MAG: hypothetical protein D6806_02615 [Deltaproteobacteria bacterium]|nr:MAG: hypothetical protein D6806_02615 [Deltaproteobacteria bacterium]